MEKIARHYYVATENTAPVQQDCPDKGRVIEQGYNHVYAHAKLLGLDGPQAMFRGIGNIVTTDDGWGKTKIASADISYRLSYVVPTGHELLDLNVDYLGGKFIVADSTTAATVKPYPVKIEKDITPEEEEETKKKEAEHAKSDPWDLGMSRSIGKQAPIQQPVLSQHDIDDEPEKELEFAHVSNIRYNRDAAAYIIYVRNAADKQVEKYEQELKQLTELTRDALSRGDTSRYAILNAQQGAIDTKRMNLVTHSNDVIRKILGSFADFDRSYIEKLVKEGRNKKQANVRVAWEMQQNRPPTPVAYLAERIARMVELTKREPQNIYQDFVKTYPHMTSEVAEELAHEVSMYGYYIKAIKVSAGDGDHLFSTPADMKMQQDKYLGDDMNKKEFTDVFHKGSPEMKPTVIDTAGDPRPKPRGIFAKLLDECYYDNKPGFTCTACGLGEMVPGEPNEDGWAPCECDKCGKTELVSGPVEDDE